jgi:hypothetical protein
MTHVFETTDADVAGELIAQSFTSMRLRHQPPRLVIGVSVRSASAARVALHASRGRSRQSPSGAEPPWLRRPRASCPPFSGSPRR